MFLFHIKCVWFKLIVILRPVGKMRAIIKMCEVCTLSVTMKRNEQNRREKYRNEEREKESVKVTNRSAHDGENEIKAPHVFIINCFNIN